jgi:membrane associated rhomboid family serine protease/tetratricopeptide (TPR) repeat protein
LESGNEKAKSGYITPATGAIIAANIIVFAVMAVFTGTEAISGPNNQVLLNFGADQGVRAMNGEYWRIITNIFVHLGLLHIFMNMWIFAVMGPNVERIYGSLKFLLAYGFAGVIASLTSIYMHPYNISAGASGAVFGIFGLWFGFLLANKKVLQENFVKDNMKSAVVFLIMVLASGFMRSGIDNAAHVGGVVAGFMCGFFLCPVFPGDPPWRKKDFLGIVLMLAVGYGAFYFANQRTHQLIKSQSVALSPADLKEPTALLKNNKLSEAVKALDSLLQKSPNDPRAHYLRALAYANLREDGKALADIDETLKVWPDRAPALQFRTERLINLGRFQEALKSADKAIAAAPNDSMGYMMRSSIYDRLDDVSKSLEDSTEAVRLAPNNANAFSHRGYSYMNLGLCDDALKDFSTALQLDKNLVGAMNGRMFAYFMQSDYIECDRQAMETLAKVGMKDPCAPYAVIMAAICRKQLGHIPERIALVNQSAQIFDAKKWPYPIIQFMNGQLSPAAVFQLATDNDKMTEAKTYIAFDLLADNKGAEASPMIVWVKEHGNKTFNEYDLVSALLNKMKK